MLVDTGSTNTVINSSFIPYFIKRGIKIRKEIGSLTLADGRKSPISGSAVLDVHLKGVTWTGTVYFFDNLPYYGILGMDLMSELAIVIKTKNCELEIENTENAKNEILQLICAATELKSLDELKKESKVKIEESEKNRFDEFLTKWKATLETCTGIYEGIEHDIYIPEGTAPIKQRYYPMSPHKLKIVHSIIEDLLAQGFIEESFSGWSSPIILLEKKNGGHRLVVDYRLVNSKTEPYAFPLPYIRDIFSKIKDAKFVSKIDLTNGYHHVKLTERSKPYTAFTVPNKGLYQYKVLPFGLSNAPATFSNVMLKIFNPVIGKFVYIYLDDILIYSNTYEEHIQHLETVFQIIKDANLKINFEKCSFLNPYVEYLGHILGQGEVRVSDKKVEAIKNIAAPKNIRQLRSFLGMVNFYRQFIPNCAEICKDLNDLLKSNIRYRWNETHEKAFQELKTRLMEPPVLHCPDYDQPMEIHTDASGHSLGAVLIQRIDKKERVIAYASRALNRCERNYSTPERECLGVIFGIEYFREYVEGTKFTVFTDHVSLTWLHSLKNPSGRLARWIIRLSPYNFEIKYKKGKLNVVPDALSRLPRIDAENTEEIEINACNIDLPHQPDFSTVQDPWYLELKQKILQTPDNYPAFRVDGHKIFKTNQDRISKQDVEKLLVPADFREDLLKHYHSSLPGGHLGVRKTFEKLQRNYYWPNLHLNVKRFIKSCWDCQQCKANNQPSGNVMADYPKSFKPGMGYAIDAVGPLPLTPRKHMYILTAVDLASRWVIALPVLNIKQEKLWDFVLEHIILKFGTPEILLNDNGSPFDSHYFMDQCEKFNISLHPIPKYTPQCNPVERQHRTVNTGLRIFAEDHRQWDNHLPYLIFSINNSISESTGFSPAKLTYGRNLRMPYELFKETDNGYLLEFQPEEYYQHLDDELLEMFESAVETMTKAHTKRAEKYNEGKIEPDFRTGQLVWRRNFGTSKKAQYISQKLLKPYIGPVFIERMYSPTQVELQTLDGKNLGRWHIKDLKHVI